MDVIRNWFGNGFDDWSKRKARVSTQWSAMRGCSCRATAVSKLAHNGMQFPACESNCMIHLSAKSCLPKSAHERKWNIMKFQCANWIISIESSEDPSDCFSSVLIQTLGGVGYTILPKVFANVGEIGIGAYQGFRVAVNENWTVLELCHIHL